MRCSQRHTPADIGQNRELASLQIDKSASGEERGGGRERRREGEDNVGGLFVEQ